MSVLLYSLILFEIDGGKDYDFCLFQGPLSGNRRQCSKPAAKHTYASPYGDPRNEIVTKPISFPSGKK